MTEQNNTVENAAAREKLEKYWLGRFRYFTMTGTGDNRTKTQMPEYLYTEWYAPEGVTREVCIELDKNNNPVWVKKEDAPPPPRAFDADVAQPSQHDLNPAAHQPTFDYTPPAYNSDTSSGGPSNFDGNAGGDNNPRNPLLEGEVPEQYKELLKEHVDKLEALEKEHSKLQAKVVKDSEKTAQEADERIKSLEENLLTLQNLVSTKETKDTKTGPDALKAKINNKNGKPK